MTRYITQLTAIEASKNEALILGLVSHPQTAAASALLAREPECRWMQLCIPGMTSIH